MHGDEALANLLIRKEVACTVNCQSPTEWDLNRSLLKDAPNVRFSFGIHPWEADRLTRDLHPYFEAADIIGEIGLDKPWTSVDFDIQLEAFIYQLEVASKVDKPVILHTTGYEHEILDIIKNYPLRYYIHWYNHHEYISDYLDLGCYFSIGPDVNREAHVADLARYLPDDRLLVETDGLEAVAWAQESAPLSLADYLSALNQTVNYIAKIRAVKPDYILGVTRTNLLRFWRNSSSPMSSQDYM